MAVFRTKNGVVTATTEQELIDQLTAAGARRIDAAESEIRPDAVAMTPAGPVYAGAKK